jgi:hypothetical protein
VLHASLVARPIERYLRQKNNCGHANMESTFPAGFQL